MKATSALRRLSSLEILETRIAPATLNLVGGVLSYTASAAIDNVLTLNVSGVNYTFGDTAETITLNAAAIAAGFTGSGTNNISGPTSAVSSISILLGSGTDTFNLNGLVDPLTMTDGADSDTVNVATGTDIVGGALTLAAETMTITSVSGVTNLTLSADALAVNGTPGFSGTLTIQQVTANRPINLGTQTAGALSITDTEFNNLLHSGTTRIGNASSGAITISTTLVGIAGTLNLKTGAGITDTATGGIQVGALAIDADANVVLDGANDVAELAALISDTGASFTYAELTEYQIATVDGIGGITTDVGAGEFVSLSAGLPVTQAAGGNIITDGLRLVGNASYTLTDSTNNVATLAANVGGVLSYTDATGLIIGSVGGTAGITTSNDSVTLVALGGDVTILNGNGTAAADIAVGTGRVNITAGAASADHAININANAGISATGTGTSISLKADRMVIGATLSAVSRAVSLSTFEVGTVVNLGGADGAAILGLSNTELNFIVAAEAVVFGESSVNVSAAIALSNISEFTLVAAGASGAGSLSVARLTIISTGAVALNGANDVDQLAVTLNGGSPFPFSFADADGFSLGGLGNVLDPGNFSIISLNAGAAAVNVLGTQTFGFAVAGNTPGVNQDQLVVQGTVTLNAGTSVSFQSVGPVAQGAEFVILSNDGADAITGTFNNLPEGTVIPNFNPRATITYVGGDGNDVAIVTTPPLAVQILPGGKKATFRDIDGDLVTVTTTKGVFDGSEFLGLQFSQFSGAFQTLKLDADFTGANITITARRTAEGGNGFVNVGHLDALGVDLGAVNLGGNLSALRAGTVGGDVKVPGMKSLTLENFGLPGDDTEATVSQGFFVARIEGALPKLVVKGDVRGGIGVSGDDGRLGSAKIGGSVTPLGPNFSVTLAADAGFGSLQIGGDLRSSATGSVFIDSNRGGIGTLTIGGAILGNAARPVVIDLAGRETAPAKGADVFLQSLKVTGSVEFLQLTAVGRSADAVIGSIAVGGDWIASIATAGALQGGDGKFGTADDVKFTGAGVRDNAALFSSIGSFTVKGQALGTATAGDMFGIVAERIGKAKVGGRTFAFTNGATPEAFFAAPTAVGAGAENPAFDFTIRELGSTTPTPAFGGSNLVVSTDGKTATFIDVDGDLVTVKRSVGTFVAGDFTIVDNAAGGGQLELLKLSAAPGDARFDLSITAKPGPEGGNGFVNVGTLGNVAGPDVLLGNVRVAGDLGLVSAGANGSGQPGVTALTVHSFRALGFSTGSAGNSSTLTGGIGILTVESDVRDGGIQTAGAGAKLGALKIGGAFVNVSLNAADGIGSVKIGGSMREGRINAAGTIGAIIIGGDVFDNDSDTIAAQGQLTSPAKGLDLAIKSITVKGSVENAVITAGRLGNADASIGVISVGRAWLASSVLAGTAAGTDTFIGTADDAKLTGAGVRDEATRFSTIASIVIKGQALGSTAGGDSFGIVAEQIMKAKIGTVVLKLDKGERDAADAFALAPTGPGATALASDFFLREITI